MKEQLIKENETLIYSIAQKFYGVPLEDLYQAGSMGLCKAIKNYKEGKTQFSTYAYKYIMGEMYELVLKSKQLKVNKDILLLSKKILQAKDYLSQLNNKVPNYRELSLFLEIDESIIIDALETCHDLISLDNQESINYADIIPTKKEDIDEQILLKDSINSLEEPMKSVIWYRYYQDMTQTEVSNILGLNQTKVSRIENNGLKQLKKVIN